MTVIMVMCLPRLGVKKLSESSKRMQVNTAIKSNLDGAQAA